MGFSSPSSNIIFSPPLEYQGSPTIDRGDSKKASPGSERQAVCWCRKGGGDRRVMEVPQDSKGEIVARYQQSPQGNKYRHEVNDRMDMDI